MSENMVERVAKAIREKRKMSLCGLCDGPHSRVVRCTCNEMARAAIEAMFEPTDAMAEFAEDNFDRNGDNIRVCHRAMITAALSSPAIHEE